MDAFSIERCIERVFAGEANAYGEIVRLYQKDVWKVVVAVLRDVKTTEDLVQQAFVNAYFHLDHYQPGTDFGHWIKAIARNLVRQELRTRQRQTRRMEVYRTHLAGRLKEDGSDDPQGDLLGDALKECRELLPSHVTEVLDLRYGRCMSFEEIAGKLGRTVEASRQMLSRVRLTLRDCIEKRMSKA
jgi:RNA polymerase sigma-70 factor, ECF subfamily